MEIYEKYYFEVFLFSRISHIRVIHQYILKYHIILQNTFWVELCKTDFVHTFTDFLCPTLLACSLLYLLVSFLVVSFKHSTILLLFTHSFLKCVHHFGAISAFMNYSYTHSHIWIYASKLGSRICILKTNSFSLPLSLSAVCVCVFMYTFYLILFGHRVFLECLLYFHFCYCNKILWPNAP